MANRIINDYTEGPVTRQLLAFAWPFMLSNLLQSAYNLADMIIVGKFVGAVGLSAVSVGGDLIHFYTFIGMGICSAGQIVISQYLGLKNYKKVSETVGTLAVVAFLIALGVTALGLVGGSTFLTWLNVPAEARDQCAAYTLCCTLGTVFIYGYNLVSSVLRGMGDSRHPMLFVGLAAVLNVALDLLLVSRGMGALGAALATVLSQAVSFIVSVIFLYRRREEFGFDFKRESFRPDRTVLGILIKLGIPLVLQSCAISVSTLFVSSFINAYGVTESAVTGVGSKLSFLVSIVTLALSQAGSTMIGQNFAARKFKRIARVRYDSYIINCLFATALSAVIFLWPEQVFSVFDNSEAVLTMSHTYVPAAILTFYGFALRSPNMAFCNGLGFATMNMTLGILDGVVFRIGLSLLMGKVLNMGVQGFWIGSALAGFVFFVILSPYYLAGGWKKRLPPVAAEA